MIPLDRILNDTDCIFEAKQSMKPFSNSYDHENRSEDTAFGKACNVYFKSLFSHDSELCLPTIVEESDHILTHVYCAVHNLWCVSGNA